MRVYRDFDQETLDREYRIRDSIPLAEFQDVIARYASESERMRNALDVRLLTPGQRRRRKLDRYCGPLSGHARLDVLSRSRQGLRGIRCSAVI